MNTTLKVLLPSNGIPYGDNIPKELTVKPITTRAEKAIYATVNKDTLVDSILKECVVEPIEVKDLVDQDKLELVRCIRMLTYGHNYKVEVYCANGHKHESGKETFELDMDLRKVDVVYLEKKDNEDVLSREIELEMSGVKIGFSLLNGELREQAREYAFAESIRAKTSIEDEIDYYIIALAISSINGDTRMSYFKKRDWLLDTLPVYDFYQLKEAYSDLEASFGIVQPFEVVCTECKHINKMRLPQTKEFFRPKYRDGRGKEISKEVLAVCSR